jgi:hypothetical protein
MIAKTQMTDKSGLGDSFPDFRTAWFYDSENNHLTVEIADEEVVSVDTDTHVVVPSPTVPLSTDL